MPVFIPLAGFPEEASPPGYVMPPGNSSDEDNALDDEQTYLTDDEEDHKAPPASGLGIKLPSQSMEVFYAAKVCAHFSIE